MALLAVMFLCHVLRHVAVIDCSLDLSCFSMQPHLEGWHICQENLVFFLLVRYISPHVHTFSRGGMYSAPLSGRHVRSIRILSNCSVVDYSVSLRGLQPHLEIKVWPCPSGHFKEDAHYTRRP